MHRIIYSYLSQPKGRSYNLYAKICKLNIVNHKRFNLVETLKFIIQNQQFTNNTKNVLAIDPDQYRLFLEYIEFVQVGSIYTHTHT